MVRGRGRGRGRGRIRVWVRCPSRREPPHRYDLSRGTADLVRVRGRARV